MCRRALTTTYVYGHAHSSRATKLIAGAIRQQSLNWGCAQMRAPFASSAITENSDEPVFNGYMYRVCRSVLEDILTTKQFDGYTIENVSTNADDILSSLNDGSIDVACGPTSITADRIPRYSVTQPVFLSGISVASLNRFPRFSRSVGYCKGVVASR